MPRNSDSFLKGWGGGGGGVRNENIEIVHKFQLMCYCSLTVYKASVVINNNQICNFSIVSV